MVIGNTEKLKTPTPNGVGVVFLLSAQICSKFVHWVFSFNVHDFFIVCGPPSCSNFKLPLWLGAKGARFGRQMFTFHNPN